MLLGGIWSVSAALAVSALLVMAALILVRLVTDRLARRRRARRDALLAKLLRWLQRGVPDEEMHRLLTKQRAIAITLLVEIFELVRGDDQERLARLADGTVLPRYLREILANGTRAERLNAAESLAWFPSQATRAALRKAIDDRNFDVGLAAAAALAHLGEIIPIEQVLDRQLGRGHDSSRRLEALLTRIAPRQSEDLLQVARNTGASQRVRAAAIEALARSGSLDLLEFVAVFADDPSPAVRGSVARSLGAFGHPIGGRTLMGLLQDAHWAVRSEAAEALGRIGLVDGAERLSALLEDENWWVRFRAGEALAALGTVGIDILRRAARDERDLRRRMASLILAERGLA